MFHVSFKFHVSFMLISFMVASCFIHVSCFIHASCFIREQFTHPETLAKLAQKYSKTEVKEEEADKGEEDTDDAEEDEDAKHGWDRLGVALEDHTNGADTKENHRGAENPTEPDQLEIARTLGTNVQSHDGENDHASLGIPGRGGRE